jgi:hypothetical protein
MKLFNKSVEVNTVFGQSRGLPVNYIERTDVDEAFRSFLKDDVHVVIYGSCRQGKTSLRKHVLSDDEYILVHCSNKWDLENINVQILKQAGYVVTESASKTYGGGAKITASIGISKMLSIKGTGGGEVAHTPTTKELDLDPSDVNDVISALQEIGFAKKIVLEDFHYLKAETQQDFAIELKDFHENSNFTFVIIGVWLEKNRLILLNGDLSGRVLSINADKWENDKLTEVIDRGQEILNFEFTADCKKCIVENSNNSVFLLQELSLGVCRQLGFIKSTNELAKLDLPKKSIVELAKNIVNQQSGRYVSFLTSFSAGFQETKLEMYRWILYPIVISDVDQMNAGIPYRFIKEALIDKHPKGDKLNIGNFTSTLGFIGSLQIRKNIKPNILDYDQSNLILNIVDKEFIVWMSFQDTDELLERVGLPLN